MKKNLLLVDDDFRLRQSISDYLSNEGFNVVCSCTGKDALVVLQERHIDLIITDIVMPILDGYDLIKSLHLSSDLSRIPIIFLTAKGMTNDKIKGYDLGCSAYLTKPFNPNELLSIIRNLLSKFEVVMNVCLPNVNYYLNNQLMSALTPKEWIVFRLVYQGLMNKEIALKLNLNLRTVEKYVSRLLTKTQTRNRTELVKLAVINHLFESRANDGIRTRE